MNTHQKELIRGAEPGYSDLVWISSVRDKFILVAGSEPGDAFLLISVFKLLNAFYSNSRVHNKNRSRLRTVPR